MKLTLVRHATLVLETSAGRVLVDRCSTLRVHDLRSRTRRTSCATRSSICRPTRRPSSTGPDIPLLTQPESLDELRSRGFVAATADPEGWFGLDVARTSGRHGTGEFGRMLGPVSGFVIDGVYVAGDTIWCDEVVDEL